MAARTKGKKKTKEQQALGFARQAAKSAKSWIEFSNALFGIGGKFGELFPSQSKRAAFVQTGEYREIMALMEELQGKNEDDFHEKLSRVNGRVLVRVPRSIHAALLQEAEDEGVSLNQLIVAKLSAQLRAVV